MTEDTTENVRLTADVVALAETGGQTYVLLIERNWPPHEGKWALPGGHVDPGETFAAAARRELREETDLDAAQLERVDLYDDPGRDSRGRYITVSHLARFDHPAEPVAGDDARAAFWVPVAEVTEHPERLAFDHAQIIADAVAYAHRSATYTANTVVGGNAQVQEVIGLKFG